WMSIVGRRRTPAEMRGARLAIPLLCTLAAGSLGYTIWRIEAGAERWLRAYGREVEIEALFGVWVIGLGILVALWGGLRLGTLPTAKPPSYRVE
ncbi:MAG: hypothetical protein AAGE52_22340, partial [Myxococcota bacterium]